MKNKHELPNGTVLEVGEKYTKNTWRHGECVEVLYLGSMVIVFIDEGGNEYPLDYKDVGSLIPYTEPKTKIKVAKYAYYSIDKWFESNCFFKSDEEFKHRYGAYSKFIRLTNTEIEVDEY